MSFARVLKHLHLGLTGFWACNAVVVVAIFVWAPELWKSLSVLYLVIVSIYANMATHWGAWQASRAEVVQVEQAEEVNVEHADEVRA